MIDNRTPNRNYPLPHGDNTLAEDVGRLRDAITAVDGDVHGLNQAVAEAGETAAEQAGRIAALETVAGQHGGQLAAVAEQLAVFPPLSPAEAGAVLCQNNDGTAMEWVRKAPEPSPSPILLATPSSIDGTAAWTLTGYPTGFGAARVEVTGDISVRINGGPYGTARTWAANGDVITVRPTAALVDGQSYSGTLRVGAATAPYNFAYVAAFVAQPSIVNPANGAIDQGETPTITTSAYDVLPGANLDVDNPHLNTDWQISTAADFATTVYTSMADATNKVSLTVPSAILVVGTTYHVRCRHRSSTGLVSAWSPTASFTTAANYGAPSVFLPSIMGNVVYGSPTMSNDGRTLSGMGAATAVHAMSGGRFYFEVTVTNVGALAQVGASNAAYDSYVYYVSNGTINHNGQTAATYASYTSGDIVMVAVDEPAGKIWFGKNGTWNGDPTAGTGGVSVTQRKSLTFPYVHSGNSMTVNFGHASFAYTKPVGFVAGSGEWVGVNDVDAVFRSVLWTGTGAANTIWAGMDMSGSAKAMLWITKRSASGVAAHVYDTVRGIGKGLPWYNGAVEEASPPNGAVTSLSSGAFSVGAGATNSENVNTTGAEYGAFIFKAAPKFMDIVTYTGNGSVRSLPHSLGSVPGMIIVKGRSTNPPGAVYHRSLGATKYCRFDNVGSFTVGSGAWGDTEPTSTHFTVGGTSSWVNAVGETYVAYLFAHDSASDGKIYCGSYTAGGYRPKRVAIGWTPQFLLIKRADATGTFWCIADLTTGGLTWPRCRSLNNYYLEGETDSTSLAVHPTDNGFSIQQYSEEMNPSAVAAEFVFMAIRGGPTVALDKPQQVYQSFTYTGSGAARDVRGLGFRADFAMLRKAMVVGAKEFHSPVISRRSHLYTSSTNPHVEDAGKILCFYPDGFRFPTSSLNESGVGYRVDGFRKSPGVCTIVPYESVGGPTVAHDLGVVPELVIIKRLDQESDWSVYHAGLGNTKAVYLHSTSAAATSTLWNNTTPTNANIALANHYHVNGSGALYVALLFASKAGISKVGTFATDASGNSTVTCGFRPRFILLKRTDSAGDWGMFSTEMGLTPSTSPAAENYCTPNLATNAEITTADYTDTTSTGFNIKGWSANAQAIFLALA